MKHRYQRFMVIAMLISVHGIWTDDEYLIRQLSNIAPLAEIELLNAKAYADNTHKQMYIVESSSHPLPLFTHYPALKKKCSYISLGSFPTPITECKQLSNNNHNVHLFIKRDDLSGARLPDGSQLLGGNKVRKLEFALADALANDCDDTITFGCAGSNHALATTEYAQHLGLRNTSLLLPQANSPIVRRNLLLQKYYDGQLLLYPNFVERTRDIYPQFMACKQKTGKFPYIIPTGASNALGALGFVNAAFELADQLKNNVMPMPDYMYVTVGSYGTLAGLTVGIKAAQLPIKIVGIMVFPGDLNTMIARTLSLIRATNSYVHELDNTFPLYDWTEEDIHITTDFGGKGYGKFTKEGTAAIEIMRNAENIILDGVYSGKAFSGLLEHIRTDMLNNATILFWNTFCADHFDTLTSQVDPLSFEDPGLRNYFIEDVNA